MLFSLMKTLKHIVRTIFVQIYIGYYIIYIIIPNIVHFIVSILIILHARIFQVSNFYNLNAVLNVILRIYKHRLTSILHFKSCDGQFLIFILRRMAI